MKTKALSLINFILILTVAGCSLFPSANPPTQPTATRPPVSVPMPVSTNPPAAATLLALGTSVAQTGIPGSSSRLVLLFSRTRPQKDGSFLASVPHNPNRDLTTVGKCKFQVSESKVQFKMTVTSKTILPAGPIDPKLVYTGLAELNPPTCSLDLAWAGPDADATNPDTEYRSIGGKIKEINASSVAVEGLDFPITVKDARQLIGFGGQPLKAGDNLTATVTYIWTTNPDPSVIVGKNKITGYNLVIGFDTNWLTKERQKSGEDVLTVYYDEQQKN